MSTRNGPGSESGDDALYKVGEPPPEDNPRCGKGDGTYIVRVSKRYQTPREIALTVGLAALLIAVAVGVFGPRVWKNAWVARSPFLNKAKSKPSPLAAAPLPEPRPEEMVPLDQVVTTVDPLRGGGLSAPHGAAALRIPPGAVNSPTAIALSRLAVEGAADPLPQAFDLRPEGLSFERPVTLAIPFPPGADPEAVEIAVFDPQLQKWVPEPSQSAVAESQTIEAALSHFSLRRLRVRPGMNYPFDPGRARAGFLLTSDAEATFERYLEGRWQAVDRKTPAARELLKAGRMGRHALIVSGRLRAVIGPSPANEPLSDSDRAVTVPAASPLAREAWVRVRRLDEEGFPTGRETLARVIGPTPAGLVAAGVPVRLSRGALEALGWRWDDDFGLSPGGEDPGWLRARVGPAAERQPFFPVALQAARPPGG